MPAWIDLAFWLGCALIVCYELYAFTHETRWPGETISEITWRIVTTHPLVPLLVGILCCHLFWQSTAVYLGHCQ